MNTDFNLIYHGIITTLCLTVVSLAIGLVCACGISYLIICGNKQLAHACKAYIATIRGTPELLQIFFIYYGLGQFSLMQHSILWPILKSAIACGIITLSNNSMAYVSNLLIGAIDKIPKTQLQAAAMLGLTRGNIFLSIQLPYALKAITPYYKNEIIMLLKSTSLVSTITVLDLTGSMNQIVSLNYQNLEWYSIGAVIYLVLSITLIQAFNVLSSKLNHYTASLS